MSVFKILNCINCILSILVSITILWTFACNLKNLRYLLNEHVEKLYLNNYEAIKHLLESVIANPQIEYSLIKNLQREEQKANLYLDKKIQSLIKKIQISINNLYITQLNHSELNEKNQKIIAKSLEEIAQYRNMLEDFYRPFFVNEMLKKNKKET